MIDDPERISLREACSLSSSSGSHPGKREDSLITWCNTQCMSVFLMIMSSNLIHSRPSLNRKEDGLSKLACLGLLTQPPNLSMSSRHFIKATHPRWPWCDRMTSLTPLEKGGDGSLPSKYSQKQTFSRAPPQVSGSMKNTRISPVFHYVLTMRLSISRVQGRSCPPGDPRNSRNRSLVLCLPQGDAVKWDDGIPNRAHTHRSPSLESLERGVCGDDRPTGWVGDDEHGMVGVLDGDLDDDSFSVALRSRC
ncbi:hypothetical protein Hypma_009420 [Hypsizygus marmoreus]|uniref:Uncharacterized protein n=1 Tax=Hypsizygus marmoreus TaxID=39966 RepID=A0A369JXB4_HYPMA|nr:hypothetical protein Hypma_009420 [Hypsizygus marmoreus]